MSLLCVDSAEGLRKLNQTLVTHMYLSEKAFPGQ